MNLIHVLTKGWLFRLFCSFLFLIAIGLTLFLEAPEQKHIFGIASLLLFANFYLLGTIGYRVALLSQQRTAQVVPDYYLKLKNSVKQIVSFSLMATLILLPDLFVVLSLMTWTLAVFIFLASTYLQPKIWFLVSALWFMCILNSFEWSIEQVNSYFFQAPAYFLPVLALLSHLLIARLDKFKMSEAVRARFTAYSGLTMASSFNCFEKIPEKSRPKFQQWMVDTNFSKFRQQLQTDKSMSKTSLVNIASSGITQFGKSSYIGWSIAIALFGIYQQMFPLSVKAMDNFYMIFFAMFSVSIVAMGSMMTFFSFNERKSYLARLRLMPLFSNEQDFTRSILKVFFINQGKLLTFTLMSSLAILLMVWPNPLELFANIFVINIVSFCFFSALVLFGWHTKMQIKPVVMVIMMLFFILLIPTAIISYDQHISLLSNKTFIGVMVTGFVLLLTILLKWKFKTPSWQKLV